MIAHAFALAFAFTSVAASSTPPRSPLDIMRGIETNDVVELGAVSYDGHLGDGSVELIALEKLGELGDDALPYLLMLSSSKSPVARVIAAAGLRARAEPIAPIVLSRLAHDDAPVMVQRGCIIEHMTVGEAVRDLAAYEVLYRPLD
jgi:hypothetical protein